MKSEEDIMEVRNQRIGDMLKYFEQEERESYIKIKNQVQAFNFVLGLDLEDYQIHKVEE